MLFCSYCQSQDRIRRLMPVLADVVGVDLHVAVPHVLVIRVIFGFLGTPSVSCSRRRWSFCLRRSILKWVCIYNSSEKHKIVCVHVPSYLSHPAHAVGKKEQEAYEDDNSQDYSDHTRPLQCCPRALISFLAYEMSFRLANGVLHAVWNGVYFHAVLIKAQVVLIAGFSYGRKPYLNDVHKYIGTFFTPSLIVTVQLRGHVQMTSA